MGRQLQRVDLILVLKHHGQWVVDALLEGGDTAVKPDVSGIVRDVNGELDLRGVYGEGAGTALLGAIGRVHQHVSLDQQVVHVNSDTDVCGCSWQILVLIRFFIPVRMHHLTSHPVNRLGHIVEVLRTAFGRDQTHQQELMQNLLYRRCIPVEFHGATSDGTLAVHPCLP